MIETLERLSNVPFIGSAALLTPRDVLVLRRQDDETVEVKVRSVLRTTGADVLAGTLIRGRAVALFSSSW